MKQITYTYCGSQVVFALLHEMKNHIKINSLMSNFKNNKICINISKKVIIF